MNRKYYPYIQIIRNGLNKGKPACEVPGCDGPAYTEVWLDGEVFNYCANHAYLVKRLEPERARLGPFDFFDTFIEDAGNER